MGPGEAQLVKCLPYKHKDLNSNPSTYGEKALNTVMGMPRPGKSGHLEAHQPTSPVQGLVMGQILPNIWNQLIKTTAFPEEKTIPQTFQNIVSLRSWVSTIHCVVNTTFLTHFLFIPHSYKSLSNPAKCMPQGNYELTAEHEEVE